jgi:hypothetical protein
MNRNKIIGFLMILPITLIAIVFVGFAFFEIYRYCHIKLICASVGVAIIGSIIMSFSLCLAEKGIRKINEKN